MKLYRSAEVDKKIDETKSDGENMKDENSGLHECNGDDDVEEDENDEFETNENTELDVPSDSESAYEPVVKKATPRKKSKSNDSDSDYEPDYEPRVVTNTIPRRKSLRGKMPVEMISEESPGPVLEQSIYKLVSSNVC